MDFPYCNRICGGAVIALTIIQKSINMEKIKLDPKKEKKVALWFENFSSAVSKAAGTTWAFIIALIVVLLWLFTGPVFHFAEEWQLMINTGTTIITFLMVFIIQKAQNKDALAIQLKLNELVAASKLASNRLVSVEDFTEEDLRVLQKFYSKLAVLSEKDQTMQQSHSIEDAEEIHKMKKSANVGKSEDKE
jgi:low affinity Fe/Cu permease